MSPIEKAQALLAAIASGEVKLTSEQEPQDVYAGHVRYLCHGGGYDGVIVVVFNDCNEWDYLSLVQFPDGTTWVEELSSLEYAPSAEEAWRCYGIPGYLRFIEAFWEGFTGSRSKAQLKRLARNTEELAHLDDRLVALINATRAVPDRQDPLKNEGVSEALRKWHEVACPTFKHSIQFVFEEEKNPQGTP